MSELSNDAKLNIVSGFLLDSPPGEINDVFNDVRVLVDDESLLENGVAGIFEEYNLEQFITVTPPGKKHQVILSKYGKVDETRYLDPRSSQTFYVDHIRQTTSDAEEVERNAETEPYRDALDQAAAKYIAEHYPNGVATVFDGNELVLQIVDNKYNPDNFWNGRWRSIWTTQIGSSEVKGLVRVNVHYYEDGNVQLTASKDLTVNIGSSSDPRAFATAAIKQIAKAEADFQHALSDKLADLSEGIFKGLRRALPITRNKINWDSIATYKIGSELSSK
ncbi:hypothetical protein SpCBS45565_g01083 [Spizellomyces sp. 'palustris']|nr:hypothetical protein SpCBS45565_g01083 [Spizellomyces sp. 'palustris']